MATSTISIGALDPVQIQQAIDKDDGEFVGHLYDTILYERACYRLYQLKKYDFPVKYEEIAHDFLTAYRLCIDPKFLANRHTAAYAHLILQSKLLTAKGVQAYARDHNGMFEIFPTDATDYMSGDEIEELDEDAFSDFDEAEQGMRPIRKNVGYNGPILTRRRQSYHNGPTSEGQGHRDGMENVYFALYKHHQDMIAVIIAHLRKRVWYHEGSGGEVVEIKNMGVDGRLNPNAIENNSSSNKADRPIKNVKGVKKYTRRHHARRRRANYDRIKQTPVTQLSIFHQVALDREPPTDYSDSDQETQELQAAVGRISLNEFTGSAKREIQWLPLSKSTVLYDWDGVNRELRLIDLPTELEDATFYGRLNRDIMARYKKLLPPDELVEKHKQLKTFLQTTIANAFPEEDLKVEPYGSFVSGLLMASSDADFCIMGARVHDNQQLNNMHHLANLLRKNGMTKVYAIPDAMVPIVKFTDPRTNMECDLNTGNNLGVINSELIRIYTTLDDRVKPFLYMIKAICKAQGINDSRNGYLSSYAITWMGIVFLQQDAQVLNPNAETNWGFGTIPILPKLQQQPFQRMKELTLRITHNTKNATTLFTSLVNSSRSDMVHCRFDDNSDGQHTGAGKGNTKSLARLLIEFFEFFSRRFNYVSMAISVGRAQMTPKTSRELHNEAGRSPTFRVVDPFLHHRNITGTCRGNSLARVWRAFDHSYRMLSSGDLEGAMVAVP
ncbi:hypothetical protein EDD11_005415 [Mortierella claussenii]|nr:hypothetical protein EDD11_005415 [Mortierella claussenii]